MSTTTTGKAIRQALATLIWGLVNIGAQAGSGASTTTLVDTLNYKGRAGSPGIYDNAIVRMTSGTLAGETTFVDYVDPATGTIYLDPALSGTPADTDEYEIWMKGVDPDDVDRLRDDCLDRICSVWRINPVTIITDGDLEDSGLTHWSVTAGGAATRTKGFASSPDAKSRRQLTVVHTTAATDMIESDTIEVQPGETYYLEVPVKCYVTATNAPATASVLPYDVVNTTNISIGGGRTTHTGRGWGRISLYFQVPTNCYIMKIRLKSDTAASTSVWGGFCLLHRNATEITLPDRVRTKSRVGKTFLTSQVSTSTNAINNTRYKLREYKNVERVQIGSNVQLFCQPGFANNSMFFYERGYFDRLETGYTTKAQRAAGDIATTDAPLEYVAAVLAEQLTKRMLDKFGADWQDDWTRASAWANYWEGEFGPLPQHIFENEVPVFIPDLKV